MASTAHASVSGNVFLQGEFLNVGISPFGTFGSTVGAPDGFFSFYGRGGAIGIWADLDGFGRGSLPTFRDSTLPGFQEESFTVGVRNSPDGVPVTLKNNPLTGNTGIAGVATDVSDDSALKARWIGTASNGLMVDQLVTLKPNDNYFKVQVTLTNVTDTTLYDVRYIRNQDPDQAVNFTTINQILGQQPGQHLVAAFVPDGTTPAFVYSPDDNSRVSIDIDSLEDDGPYAVASFDGAQAQGFSLTDDVGIAITFKLADLAPGQSTTLTFYEGLPPDVNTVLSAIVPEIIAAQPQVTVSVESVSIGEGGGDSTPFVFTVSRTGDLGAGSVVNYAVAGTGDNPADPGDFVGGVLPSGTITFAPGEATKTVTVLVAGDGAIETDETFAVVLTGGSNVSVGGTPAVFTIVNDDQGALSPLGGLAGGLLGGTGNDVLTGTTAGDFMLGDRGNDTLSGGDGNDRLYGNAGNDLLQGDGGSDTLFGGTGNDVLRGGAGMDVLEGGFGNDVFAGSLAELNGDVITDLSSGDTIHIDGATLATLSFALDGNTLRFAGGETVGLRGGASGSFVASAGGGGVNLTFVGSTVTSGSAASQSPLAVDNPLVDDRFYLATYADVKAAGASPDAHYAAFGWKEGRDPNALFDTSAYLAANPSVRAAGANPLDHYLTVGARAGLDPSAGFDSEQYLAANRDVARAGMNPLEHYLLYGKAEGRTAYAAVGPRLIDDFDPEYYLLANPDVAAAGADPLAHYLNFGAREGRDPNAVFDTSYYVAHNPDVAASGMNPLDHFEDFGWREGRNPSAAFDTSDYLAAYRDVASAGIDPLQHYLSAGRLEGRATFPANDDGLFA
ncbi:calcium-binding protein [Sphingomonas solaris]|uniref:Calx-beta domain-containing protein n=1 Tax=Alterirhizorhabdus solaris TaxID=2529389 RepID=A0A558QRI7_9SPHN|nr:Calx-beta domain-containing protein [Sphingomonas solaris]TVV69760.1 hypothetical protein FOY91_20890 [Sphingomonas solaris]